MRDTRTLLLSRPLDQSQAFADALATRFPGRFHVVIAPVLRIVPREAPIDLDDLRGLLFTSANGVEQFTRLCADRQLPAFCVGAMTAEAARCAGFPTRSADGDVAALARLVVAEPVPGKGAFLHVRGQHAAGDLAGVLAGFGIPVRAAELYEQVPCDLTSEARALLADGAIDLIALFSPRSAAILALQLRCMAADLTRTTLVALSAAADAGFDGPEPGARRIARRATREGVLEILGEA